MLVQALLCVGGAKLKKKCLCNVIYKLVFLFKGITICDLLQSVQTEVITDVITFNKYLD